VAARFAAEAVLDNRELIRERVRAESPWWVPGVVDDEIYRRIIDAVERLLRDMGTDPTHPLRARSTTPSGTSSSACSTRRRSSPERRR